MKFSRSWSLLALALILAIYYLVCGIYLNKTGYFNPETLFFIEKAKIVSYGIGYKLKVIGFTSPILPFLATYLFTGINNELAPVIASAIGMSLLFFIIANTILKRSSDNFYLAILLVLFMFHPGLLYIACSGRGTYMVLIFFYLFFLNIFKYYENKSTFHIAIAGIYLTILIFCEYKFIWLTLFFIPLVFIIAVNSLNMAEKESLFRINQIFNNNSLRRKLISKTFAIYVVLFVLPLLAILCYKLLNQSSTGDADYFHESPYATWSVLAERLNYESLANSPDFLSHDISMLISVKVLLVCPLMILALYLSRESNTRLLTLLTPFAFIEFIHIRYGKVSLTYVYFLVFIVIALMAIIINASSVKNQKVFKTIFTVLVLMQIYTGFYYLKYSPVTWEVNFYSALKYGYIDADQNENRDIADYINGLPDNTKILMDDAIAYQIVAFTDNVNHLTLPYQANFLSAFEAPWNYDNYVLIASVGNRANAYTILNSGYPPLINGSQNPHLQKVFETKNWILYRHL